MEKKNIKNNKGSIILLLLVVMFVFSITMTPIINWMITVSKAIRGSASREQALQIAEAGINYYQWHLAHFPNDCKDGTIANSDNCKDGVGPNGPYVHNYVDFDTQAVLGQYSLVITPPTNGSTIVTITSTGSTIDNPTVKRIITARYGIPSLAIYSFLANDVIWVGPTETVNGQMHSNNGIRFDGVGNAPITSAKSTYTCVAGQGSPCPALKNGVWGAASQAVQNFWQFPVPAVDFSALTANLGAPTTGMKSLAQNGGIYLPPSNNKGYSLVFNNNGTVSIYTVTSLTATPQAWDINWVVHNEFIDYNNRTKLDANPLVAGVQDYPIPANGVIYIEDNIWVEGTVKGRVMVAAAKLPYVANTAPSIYIPKNLVYQAKDGTNVLGLLAQKDIVVTYGAPTNLEIDAALITQYGSAQVFYYPSGGIRNSITIYGSTMSFGQWTWSWGNLDGTVIYSGYTNTVNTYDDNLLYAPPPSFPLSSAGYKQLSWTSN